MEDITRQAHVQNGTTIHAGSNYNMAAGKTLRVDIRI